MQTVNKPRVLGLVGATASGKTGLSLAVAQALNCEIVCLDSMQIYRRMDIGTAKPTPDERAAAPHHMLDIVDPSEPFSVAEYVSRAHTVIAGIISRGRIPLLVGGTGLYLQGLTLPMDYGGLPSDPAVRERLTQESMQLGTHALHQRLIQIDPPTASRLHPHDVRRVIRALEIYELTGMPMSAHRTPTQADAPYDFQLYAMDWPRGELHARINQRVDQMMQDGLLHEVQALLCSGVSPNAQSMQGLGYKELLPVLMENAPLETAVESIKTGTRNYARRQLIWFRRDTRIRWIASDARADAAQMIVRYWEENRHEY